MRPNRGRRPLRGVLGFAWLVREDGSGYFDADDGAAFGDLADGSDENGRIAFDDPDENVFGFLADQGRDHAGDSGELGFEAEDGGGVAEAA